MKLFSKLFGKKENKADHPFCSVIVAAAGSSRRMEGQNKLMLPLDGIPVLARTLLALEGAELSHAKPRISPPPTPASAVLPGPNSHTGGDPYA